MFDRRDVFVVVHATWIQSSGIQPSAQGTDTTSESDGEEKTDEQQTDTY